MEDSYILPLLRGQGFESFVWFQELPQLEIVEETLTVRKGRHWRALYHYRHRKGQSHIVLTSLSIF